MLTSARVPRSTSGRHLASGGGNARANRELLAKRARTAKHFRKAGQKLWRSWLKARHSVYFWACILFFAYNTGLLHVDYCSVVYPDIRVYQPVSDDDYYGTGARLLVANAPPPYDPPAWTTSWRALADPNATDDDPYGNSTDPGANCTNSSGADSAGNNCTDPGQDNNNPDTGTGNDDTNGTDTQYEWATVPDPRCSYDGWTALNIHYVVWGGLQVINSAMFVYSWRPDGTSLLDKLVIPDWLFVTSSTTWFLTSLFYADPHIKAGRPLRIAETFASVVDALASLGWCWTWYVTYDRVPGRGFTLDDPDFLGLGFLNAAAWAYLAYNAQLLQDASLYYTSYVYVTGDILYFMSGVFYLFAALRDIGALWWVPLAGGWDYEVADKKKGVVFGRKGPMETATAAGVSEEGDVPLEDGGAGTGVGIDIGAVGSGSDPSAGSPASGSWEGAGTGLRAAGGSARGAAGKSNPLVVNPLHALKRSGGGSSEDGATGGSSASGTGHPAGGSGAAGTAAFAPTGVGSTEAASAQQKATMANVLAYASTRVLAQPSTSGSAAGAGQAAGAGTAGGASSSGSNADGAGAGVGGPIMSRNNPFARRGGAGAAGALTAGSEDADAGVDDDAGSSGSAADEPERSPRAGSSAASSGDAADVDDAASSNSSAADTPEPEVKAPVLSTAIAAQASQASSSASSGGSTRPKDKAPPTPPAAMKRVGSRPANAGAAGAVLTKANSAGSTSSSSSATSPTASTAAAGGAGRRTATAAGDASLPDAVRLAILFQRMVRGWRARRLVRGWVRVVDDADGDIYWYNTISKESTWWPPGLAPTEYQPQQ